MDWLYWEFEDMLVCTRLQGTLRKRKIKKQQHKKPEKPFFHPPVSRLLTYAKNQMFQ
jgi:hypothetical protein